MKHVTLAALIGASFLAAGCKKEEPGAMPADAMPAEAVPTQAELDRQAAQEIDESNADAEMESLKEEIEKDG